MQCGPPSGLNFNHSQQILVGHAIYMQINR
ncbi:hypothetical protein SMKC081_47120 (plasmid) [Serratia marcescens]|nr:hypothetical protein SMKC081_47120 [Serratia marcescens]